MVAEVQTQAEATGLSDLEIAQAASAAAVHNTISSSATAAEKEAWIKLAMTKGETVCDSFLRSRLSSLHRAAKDKLLPVVFAAIGVARPISGEYPANPQLLAQVLETAAPSSSLWRVLETGMCRVHLWTGVVFS